VCTSVPLVDPLGAGWWHGSLCACADQCIKVARWRADTAVCLAIRGPELDAELPTPPLCASLRF
jgi:hypothetical protein